MKRILLILVGFSLVLFSAFAGGGKETEVLRFGGQYYPEDFLMEGHDFFEEFGINIEHTLFSSGTENNEALISGNIDVNVGSDSKTVALFNAIGDKALIIGTVQKGNRYSTMVPADSDYQRWEDLKGKKVGTRFGTGADFVLRKYFDSQPGLSWDDFQWINIKTEDMIAALDNGQIEAFTVWAPTGEIAEAQGIARPIRNYGDVALTPVSIHTTKKYAENNRDTLVRFIAAHLRKAEMIKNNPEQAAEYAAEASVERGFDVSADAFRIIFERIDFQIDFDESLIEELKSTAQFLYEEEKINEIPDFYYDTTIVEDAKKLLKE
jgi:NitT/TauT family transport system substrate-binding protein